MSDAAYVHGYSVREAARLSDQAGALSRLLHHDTQYPAGSHVLECGCGTGAQTVLLASSSPEARIVSMDMLPASVEEARRRIEGAGFGNVAFQAANVYDLPFHQRSFDHVFVCFLLEHLSKPLQALHALRQVLRPGGSSSEPREDTMARMMPHEECCAQIVRLTLATSRALRISSASWRHGRGSTD